MEDMFNLNDDEEVKRKELAIAINSNLANVCLKLKKWNEALKVCEAALKFDSSAKIFFRRGCAFKNIHDFDSAIRDLKRAIELEPSDGAIKKELTDTLELKKEEDQGTGGFRKDVRPGRTLH